MRAQTYPIRLLNSPVIKIKTWQGFVHTTHFNKDEDAVIVALLEEVLKMNFHNYGVEVTINRLSELIDQNKNWIKQLEGSMNKEGISHE